MTTPPKVTDYKKGRIKLCIEYHQIYIRSVLIFAVSFA